MVSHSNLGLEVLENELSCLSLGLHFAHSVCRGLWAERSATLGLLLAQQLHLERSPLLVGVRVPSIGILPLGRVRRHLFGLKLSRLLTDWLCDKTKLRLVSRLCLALERDVVKDALL